MAKKRQGKRQQLRTRPSLLLYTTGLRTERLYLEWLRSTYNNQNQDRMHRDKNRMRFDIKTSSDSPETTVSTYKRHERDYDYDEVWFIVDKDEDDLAKFVNLCK